MMRDWMSMIDQRLALNVFWILVLAMGAMLCISLLTSSYQETDQPGDEPSMPVLAGTSGGRTLTKLGPEGEVISVEGFGFAIVWESEFSRADPVDVLRCTARRMEYVQTTPEASTANAKALFAVLQAIDYIQGTEEVTAPIEDSQ